MGLYHKIGGMQLLFQYIKIKALATTAIVIMDLTTGCGREDFWKDFIELYSLALGQYSY